jgi:hypothetical protein
MSTRLIAIIFLVSAGLGCSGLAKADTQNIQLVCVSVRCTPGGIQTTQDLTGTTLELTGNSNAAGWLYIGIYTPVFDNSGNFTGPNSKQLWSVLEPGVSPGNGHNYGSSLGVDPFASASTGFNVYDYFTNIQFASGCHTSVCTSPTFTVPGSFPDGTMFIAFTENASGDVIASTPWSESVLAAPEPASLTTPEPSTGLISGACFLLCAGLAMRRKIRGCSQTIPKIL